MTGRYVVTIAYNHGRDESSRRAVSRHRSAHAALIAAHRSRNNNGWTPRIECSDVAALNELFDLASQLTTYGAHDYRWIGEGAIAVGAT